MAGNDLSQNFIHPLATTYVEGLLPGWDSQGGNNQALAQEMFGGMLQPGQMSQILGAGQHGYWTAKGPQGDWPSQHLAESLPSGYLTGYYGSPTSEGVRSRFGDASDAWGRRFDQGAVDANGNQVSPSVLQAAGQRSFQGFGGRAPVSASNPYGWEPTRGSDYDLYQTFAGNQAQAGANPYLDPQYRTQLLRAQEASNQMGMPDPYAYAQGQGNVFAQGPQSAGAANALTSGVAGMNNAYEQGLTGAIDYEAQRSLSSRLQDTMSTLSSMGLGRSGMGMMQAQQNQADILGQANRDKQSVMAQFAESAAGRNAAALGQASGMMSQEAMAEQARRGQVFSQGLGDLSKSQLGAKEAERNLLAQSLGDYSQNYNQDQQRMLSALTASDQASLQRLIAESQEQSRGQQDYMNLWGLKDQMYDQRLGSMLDMEDRMRGIQQEQLDRQLYFNMLPWQSIMTMVTGVSPTSPPQTRQSPWAGALAGGVGSAVGAAGANYFRNEPTVPLGAQPPYFKP